MLEVLAPIPLWAQGKVGFTARRTNTDGQEPTVATGSFLADHIAKKVFMLLGAVFAGMRAKKWIYRAGAFAAARLRINSSIWLVRALSRMACASGRASVKSGDAVAKSPCLAATRAIASIEPGRLPCT